MRKSYTMKEVFDYWTGQAKTHGRSYEASWSDVGVINLEIKEILKHLKGGDKVLDIGCANGYSSIALALEKKIRIKGVDYIPEMIVQAKENLKRVEGEAKKRVEFGVGDITELKEKERAYDKLVVIRVLINLGSWKRQKYALEQCARFLKPGGLLLLSEATVQGWQALNRLRAEWKLAPIPMPPFNTYLDQDKVVEAAKPFYKLEEISDFASTYYVGTRLLKPLLAKNLGLEGFVADPRAEWNRWFTQMPQWGDYGTQKLFVLRKK